MDPDEELKQLLLEHLRSQRSQRQRSEARQEVNIADYIDWRQVGAMTGYVAGGPILHRLLKKFISG